MTYGDCLSVVNIAELIAFHKKRDFKTTWTAFKLSWRILTFILNPVNNLGTNFREKPYGDGKSNGMTNGFFVLEPYVFGDMRGFDTSLLKGVDVLFNLAGISSGTRARNMRISQWTSTTMPGCP